MIIMAISALLLTADETLTTTGEKGSNSAVMGAVIRGILAALASDLVCYFLVWFFVITGGQKDKLVSLLKTNSQLKMLRRWFLIK